MSATLPVGNGTTHHDVELALRQLEIQACEGVHFFGPLPETPSARKVALPATDESAASSDAAPATPGAATSGYAMGTVLGMPPVQATPRSAPSPTTPAAGDLPNIASLFVTLLEPVLHQPTMRL